ncbi:hypothetical protein G6F43_011344 [Rhizopus delemar]|nr:hypothetical protein G6F43_011344 [Rhizopus delemar]
MMGNAHGGVLQNNGMPGRNWMSAHGIPEVIGVNATGGRAINNGGSREVLPSGVIPNKPVKKRAPRKKARRLPVKLRGGRTIWDILDQCKADITATELIALDVKAQKDMVDGIRFLRENKRKLRKPVEAMEVDQGTGVDRVGEAGSATNPAVVNVVDQDWETEDSLSDEASTDLSSMYFEDDGSDDDQASMVSETDDGVSVYCYPYNLQRMKVSSPLRGAIMINDKPVEVVFDTGASVSVIGKGLVDSLGLVPNGDTLPLTGFDNKKGPSSPIVMDVPIRIAGKLRPEHMCIQPTGNDNLCLLGIPWFQAYGIEIDVVNSCVKIPTTSGMVKLQAYTTHLPVPVASMSGGGVGGVVFPVVDSNVSTAATMGSDRQVYMVDASQHHCDNYEEDLLPVGEPIKEEIKFDAENITMGVPDELVEVIERYKNCFSEVSGLGRVKNYVMDIPLVSGATPIRSKPFRMTWQEEEALDAYLEELLDLDIIKPSNGLWTSPCFFIPKKDGTLRLVIDYRRLNKMIKQDAYPLPHIDELLDAVGGATVFSTLDCTSGYHQLPLNPEHAERTGFVTKKGTFSFNVLPFGITTGCSQYQRMMNSVLSKYVGDFILIFLDDILVYSKNMEDHKVHLSLLMEACQEVNLRLKRKKCRFGDSQVEYLGHLITGDGVLPSDYNIDKVKKFSVPANVDEVRSFLGLTGYYRKYVPNYASVAEPLTRLTKKKVSFSWGAEQQAAFDHFLVALTRAPILVYPDRQKVQVLSVDASGKGLGAVLSQVDDAATMTNERVISYASRGLRGSERNYAITHLEALAVVWGVTHYKHYLKGRHFILITDHSSLVYIFRPTRLTPKLSRWAACLLDYDFEIRYRAGVINPADVLSRMVLDECTAEVQSGDFIKN